MADQGNAKRSTWEDSAVPRTSGMPAGYSYGAAATKAYVSARKPKTKLWNGSAWVLAPTS